MAKLEISDTSFEKEVLRSDVPVLVDFWAPWCGPCKLLGPIVDALATEYAGKPIKIASLNVDESPETAGKYQVMSIPTLIMFKNGKPVNQMVGLQPKAELKERIDEQLA